MLGFFNLSFDIEATANWSFFFCTVLTFVDPVTNRAESAPEFTAILTVVLDVTEIKFGLTALLSTAICRLDTFVNQSSCLWMSGKIDWRMTSSILEMDISSKGHKAFQYFCL